MEFAGFKYPKFAWTLPRGSLRSRIKDRKNLRTNGYYKSEPNVNRNESGFYLDSDFMPGLRWSFATLAGHRFDDSPDEISGIVMRLTRNRGFIPGWTMGTSMASGVEHTVFNDAQDCAMYADELARTIAEKALEQYEQERCEENDEETLRE